MLAILIWMFILSALVIAAAILYNKRTGLVLPTILLVLLAASPVGIGLASYPIAKHIAQQGAIGGYHQWFNSSVKWTHMQEYSCHRDGDCTHTYDCPETVPDGVDKDGHPKTKTVHHDCPYVTKEYTYWARDAIGIEHAVGGAHRFAEHPKDWDRWDFHGIPSGVPRGVPSEWTKMEQSVAAGRPRSITFVRTYENYILADQHTLWREHSDDVKQLKKLQLLPDPAANLHNSVDAAYQAAKVSFVKFQPANAAAWQQTLMDFNAALGMEHQGDMHVVVIKDSTLTAAGFSPVNYALGLKAHWLNDLGKYALPKNGIMLVLGVDDSGSTVKWSQAATGMPKGNDAMLNELSNLNDTPFTTAALFGSTTATLQGSGKDAKVSYQVGAGKVPNIIMQQYPFKRACMKCTDKSEKGEQGFTYLSTEIPITTGAEVGAILIDYLIVALLVAGTFFWNSYRQDERRSTFGTVWPFSSTPSVRRFTKGFRS